MKRYRRVNSKGGSLKRKTGDDVSRRGAWWQENCNSRQEEEKQQRQSKRLVQRSLQTVHSGTNDDGAGHFSHRCLFVIMGWRTWDAAATVCIITASHYEQQWRTTTNDVVPQRNLIAKEIKSHINQSSNRCKVILKLITVSRPSGSGCWIQYWWYVKRDIECGRFSGQIPPHTLKHFSVWIFEILTFQKLIHV